MEQAITKPRYYVGIDLALRAKHVARLVDDRGRPVRGPLRFGHTYDEMEAMFETLTARVPDGYGLAWGCEATGAAWKPVTAFLLGRDQDVSLENPAGIAALRDVESRFFKNDQVDAATIAQMLLLKDLRGKPFLPIPSPSHQAMRCLARDIEKLTNELTRVKTRLTSLLCDLLLPSLNPSEHQFSSPTLLRVLNKYADPRDIARKTLRAFIKSAKKIGGPSTSETALSKLHAAASDAVRCYGADWFDYDTHAFRLRDTILAITQLQDRIKVARDRLQTLLSEACTKTDVDYGLTVPGVGRATFDMLAAFYGPVKQWAPFKAMKRVAGAVPIVDESGNTDTKRRMSKLGEPALRKIIFQIGNIARRCDAYAAAIYYDQMVNKAKGHVAACIKTGLHVLNCLRAVLREGRGYQYRDPATGDPITREQSRQLALTVYVVPEEVRAARAKHKRNAHAEPKQALQAQQSDTEPVQTLDDVSGPTPVTPQQLHSRPKPKHSSRSQGKQKRQPKQATPK